MAPFDRSFNQFHQFWLWPEPQRRWANKQNVATLLWMYLIYLSFFFSLCCIFLVVRAERGVLAQIFQCCANTLLWVVWRAGCRPLTFTPWLLAAEATVGLSVCVSVCEPVSKSLNFMAFPLLTCHTHDKCFLLCTSVFYPRGVCARAHVYALITSTCAKCVLLLTRSGSLYTVSWLCH